MRVLFVSLVFGAALLSGVGSVNAKAIKLENGALDRVTAGAANAIANLPSDDEALWNRLTRTIVGNGEQTLDGESQTVTNGLSIQESTGDGEGTITAAAGAVVKTSGDATVTITVRTTGDATVTTMKSASGKPGDSGSSVSTLAALSSVSTPDLTNGGGSSQMAEGKLTSISGARDLMAAMKSRHASRGHRMPSLPRTSAFGRVSGPR